MVTVINIQGKILVDDIGLENWFQMQLFIVNLLGLHICFELSKKGKLIYVHKQHIIYYYY